MKRKPRKARSGLGLRLGGIALAIWLVFCVVITWCTAQTMDRYLAEENGQHAYNVVYAGNLEYYAQHPEASQQNKGYWIWDAVNGSWLNNDFGGGLLRQTNQQPQTAAVIYDGKGNLLEKNGNAFYFFYMTEQSWFHQESDMHIDGAAKVLYEPSEITEIGLQDLQRTDYRALRFTGAMEDGCLTVSRIEYIPESQYRDIASKYYGDGSYERHKRIQEMEEKYGLQWQPLLASSYDAPDQQVYYTVNGHVSYYDTGESLDVGGKTYENLMAYVLQIDNLSQYNDYSTRKQGNLFSTVMTSHRTVYAGEGEAMTPAYRVVAAVRYSPVALAVESLTYVYIWAFFLLGMLAFLLWRGLCRKLIQPVEAFEQAADQDWKYLTYPKDDEFYCQEVLQLKDRYAQAREERNKDKGELSRLNVALEYAREAETNRRQMTSSIAHELKTPLAVIHSYAEGLKEHIAEEKRDKYIDVILSEAERTDAMVLEMLDLSRLEAGKVRLSREDFSLTELTRSIFEKLEMAVEAKELQLELAFPKDCTVTADEGRIAQTIENFATNAIKYTPHGGRIWVKIYSDRFGTKFLIENESQPLSAEALGRVWDTFYRTDEARSGGGTGLGLAIAKNIIELHGGKCFVENTKRGVQFSFRI